MSSHRTNEPMGTWAKVLRQLVDNQMALSAMVDGEPLSINRDNPAIYFAALNTELGELLNHFNWKPWKEPKEVDVGDTAEEWADCLAFFLVITSFVMEATGLDYDQMVAYHISKSMINRDRFLGLVSGYGVRKVGLEGT